MLAEQGIKVNQLQVAGWCRCMATRSSTAAGAKKTIIVENNFSASSRATALETSFVATATSANTTASLYAAHIVDSVREQLAGQTTLSVPP